MTAIQAIEAEVRRATAKHSRWPTDPIHAAAIVGEEAGELVKASLDCVYHGEDPADMDTEAIQTAATCLRFLRARGWV